MKRIAKAIYSKAQDIAALFLKKSFNKVLQEIEAVSGQVNATRSLEVLSPLLHSWSFLPMTDWAAGPAFYWHICNDIIINRRKNIVDAGSGISTILMARLLKMNKCDAHIYSIDSDAEWQQVVRQVLQADGIENYVDFVAADIVKNEPIEDFPYLWYDTKSIDFVSKNIPIDLLVVDGPRGDSEMVRFGALPFFSPYLGDSFSIFLHDTDRVDEMASVVRWSQMRLDAELHHFFRYSLLNKGAEFGFSPQRYL